jgi:hypothetical protein
MGIAGTNTSYRNPKLNHLSATRSKLVVAESGLEILGGSQRKFAGIAD